jgi:hypothetical protein
MAPSWSFLILGVCRRIPSSARERAIFSPGKDGEAGDVGFIVDAAGCSQAEKGPLEARSSSPTGSWIADCGFGKADAKGHSQKRTSDAASSVIHLLI